MSYSRDSFDRFGDDLCAHILSFLDRKQQIKLSCVCSQWKNHMYAMSHFVTIECDMFFNRRGSCCNTFDNLKTIAYFKNTQNRRTWKMALQFKCPRYFDYIPHIIRNTPNLKELKIELHPDYNFSVGKDFIGEEHLQMLSYWIKKSNIEKLYLALPVKFKNLEKLESFVSSFKEIICELWVDMNNTNKYLTPMIENLKMFSNLKTLALVNWDPNKSLYSCYFISKYAPKIETLIIKASFAPHFGVWSIDCFLKSYPNLKYLLVHRSVKPELYSLVKSKQNISISELKPLVYSTLKCEPLNKPLVWDRPIYRDVFFLFYSKKFNAFIDFMCLYEPINIPNHIENYIYLNRFGGANNKYVFKPERDDRVISFINDKIKNSNLKRIRTEYRLNKPIIRILAQFAEKFPREKYMISDETSQFLWTGSDESANLKTTILWRKNEDNKIIFK